MQFTSKQILELLQPKAHQKKSGQEIANFVRILFGNPHGLIQKVSSLSTKIQKNRQKQFDIPAIAKIYENVEKLGKSKQITNCFIKTLQEFEEPGRLKQFLKSKNQMKYFFIMILWEKLFTQPFNNLALLKCLNLINNSQGYLQYFKTWVNQIDQHYITLIMNRLHQCIQIQFQNLIPDKIEAKFIPIVQLNLENICKFIKIIYQSNIQHKRVPKSVFINPLLPKYFDSTDQFRLFYHKKKERNLIEYPFLMPLQYKYELLKIQSIVEQKVNIKKNMEGGIGNMINAMIQNENNFSIEGLIYLHFQVNRHNILDDSMQKLGKVKQNLKSPMRISFVGQEGSDEGGVKNQYFQLVTKQIFNPYLDMFLPKHNGRVYWFNGFSYQPPIRFQFVGMLLGLAIYNSVHLNIPFPDLIYKKLLNKSQEEEFSLQLIEDLLDIEPDIYKGLKKIIAETQPLDDLELYFTIQLESFGQIVVQELVEEGSLIKVSQDNKSQYCQLYSDYLINKHCKKQFDAFRKGFYKVVSGKMIELFDIQDLRTIIYGNDKIDFKELQQSTAYEGGYDKDSSVVRNLWELLHSLDLQDKKAFLVFVTGSDRVPIQGLKSLGFVIQRNANTQNLPTAHTCFNVFLLPQYETKAKLQKNIRLILQNNQGFGLI